MKKTYTGWIEKEDWENISREPLGDRFSMLTPNNEIEGAL